MYTVANIARIVNMGALFTLRTIVNMGAWGQWAHGDSVNNDNNVYSC